MRLEFINHSSFIVERGSTVLMCDFWKEGLAFDNGWSLLCETPFDYDDFARVTHIWFSHEHPDHFSPDNLLRIPENLRANISVLFQHTEDKRLVSFCQKKGFKEVVELRAAELYQLGDEIELRCEGFGSYWGEVDSWLYIKSPELTLLNLNDCEVHSDETAQSLASRCQQWGGPLDLLMTQFSYASKQGNADDSGWPVRARAYFLDMLDLKLRHFKPKFTLPFASYVYFCHVENRYLNSGLIRVHDIIDTIEKYSQPVVLYPQDRWEVGVSHDNSQALERYQQRYDYVAELAEEGFEKSEPATSGELQQAAAKFLDKMLVGATSGQLGQYLAIQHSVIRRRDSSINRWVKVLLHTVQGALGSYTCGRIYVQDHQQGYELSLAGLTPSRMAENECQISIHSSALLSCFKVAWGGETLQVNGRFHNNQGQWELLSQFFFLARKIEQGFELPRYVTLNFLLDKLRA